MGRSKRSSAVAASLRLRNLTTFDALDAPSKQTKTLTLTYSKPRSTRQARKPKKKAPEFIVHEDSSEVSSVDRDERLVALEAWIDDDEQDRVRPNGEVGGKDV